MKFLDVVTEPVSRQVAKEQLLAWCPDQVATQLLEFYKITDGIESGVEGSSGDAQFDHLRIDEYEFLIDQETREVNLETFPGLFQIGSDGAGQVLAFDIDRGEPYPIVMHCPGFHGPKEAPIIAPSIDVLLQKLGLGPQA